MALLTPVAAPEIVPAPFGLFSLDAEQATDSTDRWLSGLSVESRACGITLRNKDFCDSTLSSDVFVPTDDQAALCAYTLMPIDINVEMPERSVLGMRAQNYELWVEEALLAGSQKALERELWTGGLADAASYDDNRRLTAGTTVTDLTPGGTAVKIRYGLALLEGALGDCGLGGPGTIHMRREVASPLSLRSDNGTLRTNLGNAVIAGSGYTGAGPDGTIPGTGTWIYATGPTFWWLGAPEVYPDPNRLDQAVRTDINSVKWYAQRPGAVSFDGCCIFAVHIDLSLDYQ